MTLADGTYRAKKKGEENLYSDALWKIVKEIYAVEDRRKRQRSIDRIRKNLEKNKACCSLCGDEVNGQEAMFTRSDNGTTVICSKCFNEYFTGVKQK